MILNDILCEQCTENFLCNGRKRKCIGVTGILPLFRSLFRVVYLPKIGQSGRVDTTNKVVTRKIQAFVFRCTRVCLKAEAFIIVSDFLSIWKHILFICKSNAILRKEKSEQQTVKQNEWISNYFNWNSCIGSRLYLLWPMACKEVGD